LATLSGILNPADLPTHGITACELAGSRLWWTGPSFWQQEEQLWPNQGMRERNDEINQ